MERKVYFAECTGIPNCAEQLQSLIDKCYEQGGGQIRLMAGKYTTSTIYLKSNVELFLDAGAVLAGVDDYKIYSNQCPKKAPVPNVDMWYDAIITAVGQKNIAVRGEGLIDGVDCLNPEGEQDFRGPHSLFFFDCQDVEVAGITIVRSACYNIMFEDCERISVRNVNIRGGQDGLRFGHCRDAVVDGCDIRSGDDCIGGSGNYDIRVFNTKMNTPGTTILFSCVRFTIKNCLIWSVGEYPAIFNKDKRYSWTNTAIYAGYDYGYEWTEPSSDWLIEDVRIENVNCPFRFYSKFHNGEPTIPIRNVTFNRVTAVNLTEAITCVGNDNKELNVTIKDSSFSFVPDCPDCKGIFMNVDSFGIVSVENTKIKHVADKPFVLTNGDRVCLKNNTIENAVTECVVNSQNINEVFAANDEPQTVASRYAVDKTVSIVLPKEQNEEFRGPALYYNPQIV